MFPTVYTTIASPSQAEFKDKGSRFIAFAYPADDEAEVKKLLDKLRPQYHKARHICYAYRIGVDGNRFRANDDGEPSGSAGRPILGQIDSFGLTDTLVAVVRYFGGTLLGVPGLIHAYKTATASALRDAVFETRNIEKTVWLQCGYDRLSEILRIAERYRATVVAQDLQSDCRLTVRVPLDGYDACIAAWRQTRAVGLFDQPFQAA